MTVPSRVVALRALVNVALHVTSSPADAFDKLPRVLDVEADLAQIEVSPAAVILLAATKAIASRSLSQLDIFRFQEVARLALPGVRDDLFAASAKEARACC